jgi:hypothetical protein
MNLDPCGKVVGVGWFVAEVDKIKVAYGLGRVVAKGAVLLNEGIGPGKGRRGCGGLRGGKKRECNEEEQRYRLCPEPYDQEFFSAWPHAAIVSGSVDVTAALVSTVVHAFAPRTLAGVDAITEGSAQSLANCQYGTATLAGPRR